MNKKELEIFYELDSKKYLVKKNEHLRQLIEMQKKVYNEEVVQNYINRLISWYGIKYSDLYIEKLINSDTSDADKAMILMMSFDSLKNNFDTREMEIFSRYSNKNDIIQKYLIELVGFGLIYSKKSTPKYGYYRAGLMFNEFNDYFHWDLNTEIFDEIMCRDYSPDNEEIKKILSEKRKKRKEREKEVKAKKLSKVRALFKW